MPITTHCTCGQSIDGRCHSSIDECEQLFLTNVDNHYKMEEKNYPGSEYQPLFDYLIKEHGLTLLQGQMDDLINVVHKYHPAGAVWVKASEFKTNEPVFRPFRRKREDGVPEYDYGEIYVTEDNGEIFLDINNERSYEPQHFERWKDYEILDESPTPAADWAKEYDTLYYIVMPVLNKLRHRTDNDTRMMERGGDIRDTIHKALADIKKLPQPISSNEPPFLVQSEATPAPAREEDAVSFAEWAATIAFFDDGTRLWELLGEGEAINGQFRFTTKEFYQVFKQQHP